MRHFFALLLLLVTLPLHAIEVRPLVSTWPENQRSGVLTVVNPSDAPKTFQLVAYDWSQVDGQDVRVPTESLRFSPSVFTVEPDSRQVVRFQHRPEDRALEHSYRLVLLELPEPDPNRIGITIALELDFPWFWRQDPRALPTGIHARVEGNELVVSNTGPITAQLSALDIGPGLQVPGLVGYVLPGSTMRFPVRGEASGSLIRMRINGQEQQWDVD
ncbi:MAG: fimbrial biogenesis chaperone [Lysobacteraceae bacterium]